MSRKSYERFEGIRGFGLLYFGQFISIFATRMTGFAVTLWAWALTGEATTLVLVGIASFLPQALVSPIAGTLVDRWNRKLILAVSDAASAISTAVILFLFATEQLELWHLYATGVFTGIFSAFQYPAYASVVTLMVPKEHYARANSMGSIIGSASGIGAPLLAGVLIGGMGLNGILIIDLITFAIAVSFLLFIFIPELERGEDEAEKKTSIVEETVEGFRYVFARPSLFAFFMLFLLGNIGAGFTFPMTSPMILAKTGNDAQIFGMVNSAGSIGFLAGGLLMSVWGGPKRRIRGILNGYLLWGLTGPLILAFSWGLPGFLIGSFLLAIFNPIINGSYQAIIQSKVVPEIQGRIFGVDMMLTTLSFPLAQLLAGYFVDEVLEPGMAVGGDLVGRFGGLFGVGVGSGYGVLLFIGGLIAFLTGVIGWLIPRIRTIEDILPDHRIIAD